MLDIKQIIADPDTIRHKTALRGIDINIAELTHLDTKRKTLIQEAEEFKRLRNELSKQVGILKKEGKDTTDIQIRVKEYGNNIETLDAELKKTDEILRQKLLILPNIVDNTVPAGKNENDNTVYRVWGEPPKFAFEPKAHWDIGTELEILDFERGTKVAKARFTMLVGAGARLERALINFMMDLHASRGYKEILPPYLINSAAMTVTGQLPKFQEDAFWCERDNLYLTPTAEVPVTNFYTDEILKEIDLPIKFTSYSACFRREAGSYGKDVRGLNRLHQFDKVEIVRIDTPEHSYQSLKEMVDYVESLIEKLELPWRILRLCGGDMSFTSSLTFDFEVYSAAQNRWLEVSSVSNFESYQANRLKCRYRDENKKTQLCHTLNGSALALPRIVAALLENNQTPDGIHIPKTLVPYTRFEMIK